MSMPPQPPTPPKLVRRPRLALHLPLTLLTIGFWGPIWAMAWWTADARNHQEQDRFHREWAAYQHALQHWRWSHITHPQPYGPPR